MHLPSFIIDFLSRLAESYLYPSTRQRISTLFSDSNQTTRETLGNFFEGGASDDGMELWLDIFLILGVLLAVISVTNCCGYLSFWFCCRIRRQAKEIDDMRKGTLPYQKKAKSKRGNKHKARDRSKEGENGNEEGDENSKNQENNLDDDFHLLNKAIGEMRQELTKSEKTLKQRISKNTAHPDGTGQTAGKNAPELPPAMTFQRTKRQGRTPSPASFIRGLPSVQFLLSSPNYRFFVFSCRSKRKTYVVPQGRRLRDGIPEYTGKKDEQEVEVLSPSVFLSSGRDLLKKQTSYCVVEEVSQGLLHSGNRIEFYSAQFVPSTERNLLIMAERCTDSFLVYQLGGLCDVELLHTYKMPEHRLVSSLPFWTVLCSSSLSKSGHNTSSNEVKWEGIISFQPKDAVAELFQRTVQPSASKSASATLKSASAKFKVGSASSWCYDRGLLAVGGTFMREPRLCSLEVRPDKKDPEKLQVEPKPLVTLGSSSSGTSFAGKLRVVATAIVKPGLPAHFNTRSYWIIFFENGVGLIYNIEDYDTPELACTFTDTDFAGFTPDEPVTLLTAMQGASYKERLILGIAQGSNLSVYQQGGFALPFEMVRRDDLHSAAEGNYIQHICFLCGGQGVALSGREDGAGIRLFELTE